MGKMQNLLLAPEAVEAYARSIKIRQQGKAGRAAFRFNEEQRLTAIAASRHNWVYCLKSRQVGLTTFWLLWDVLWVMAHDAARLPVRCVLLWDDEDNVKSKVKLCEDFCTQLGIVVDPTAFKLTFPNGSEIVGITAGGRTPGRGLDGADRIHASEVPYWVNGKDTWAGVTALISENQSVTIETTMSMKELLASELWEDDNAFHKLFLPFSVHSEYRDYPRAKLLREDQIELLEREGFKVNDADPKTAKDERAAGAYWLRKLRTDCRNDWSLLYKDYPQLPEHAFAVSDGLWVKSVPAVLEPLKKEFIDGVHGTRWELDIWRHKEDVKGLLVIGVDTSKGVGLDYSAVCVRDSYDGAICASFADNTILYTDLARIAKRARDVFHVRHEGYAQRPLEWREPRIVVETNGVGDNTSIEMSAAGLPHERVSTSRDSKYRGMRAAKAAVEGGAAFGPKVLNEEARSCYYEGRDWKGRKDFLMTYGFCVLFAERMLGIKVDETLKPETRQQRTRQRLLRRRGAQPRGF